MKWFFMVLLTLSSLVVVAQEDGSDCTSCCDGIDNDGDGHIDFKDWDCKKNSTFYCSYCSTESSCDNGVDDDGDGLVDNDDPDCGTTICDSPIWEEDFESYSNGTMNTTKWTTVYNDCDDADINSGNNYWGVYNGEFRVNDIEGQTCCGGGGENDNYFTTEIIDVSSYGALSISMEARVVGDVECSSTCNSGDVLIAQYEIDGNGWNTFYEICGATSGFSDMDCDIITLGDDLQIRIMVGNQANSETYYFDNIKVCPDNCGVPLTLNPYLQPKVEPEPEDTIPKKIIKYWTLDGRETIHIQKGVLYIVTYDDYSRGKILLTE
jgi:hypothetical protein